MPKLKMVCCHNWFPTRYMIFDDHDITDDWNLTIG